MHHFRHVFVLRIRSQGRKNGNDPWKREPQVEKCVNIINKSQDAEWYHTRIICVSMLILDIVKSDVVKHFCPGMVTDGYCYC